MKTKKVVKALQEKDKSAAMPESKLSELLEVHEKEESSVPNPPGKKYIHNRSKRKHNLSRKKIFESLRLFDIFIDPLFCGELNI